MLPLVFLGALGSGMAQMPDAESLEQQVLDYRRSLHAAELILHQTAHYRVTNPRTVTRTTFIWLDGDSIRCDIIAKPEKATEEERQITCNNCQLKKYFMSYTEIKSDPGKIPIIFEPLNEQIDPNRAQILDPRLLGMEAVESANLCRSRLDSVVGRPDRSKPEITRDQRNGVDCYRISYKLRSGDDVRVWIDSQRGPSVLRMEIDFQIDGERCMDSVESELHDFGKGLWFPRKTTYVRECKGKLVELKAREVAEIEVKSLNQSLPEKVFNLAGMSLREGTPIVGLHDVSKGPVFWDGNQISSKAGYRLPAEIEASNTVGRSRKWLVWLSIGSGVLAVLLVAVYVPRRLGLGKRKEH